MIKADDFGTTSSSVAHVRDSAIAFRIQQFLTNRELIIEQLRARQRTTSDSTQDGLY